MAKRVHTVYGSESKGAPVIVEKDQITPFLDMAMATMPRQVEWAARRTAYWLRGVIIDDLKAGKVASMPVAPKVRLRKQVGFDSLKSEAKEAAAWAKDEKQMEQRYGRISERQHERKMRRWAASRARRKLKRAKRKHGDSGNLFGRLVKAVGYVKRPGGAEVGWLSKSAARIGGAMQEGRRGSTGVYQFRGVQAVTPRMRRYMSAMGIGIRRGTSMRQAPRPIMRPEIERRRLPILQFFEGKVRERIASMEVTSAKDGVMKAMLTRMN